MKTLLFFLPNMYIHLNKIQLHRTNFIKGHKYIPIRTASTETFVSRYISGNGDTNLEKQNSVDSDCEGTEARSLSSRSILPIYFVCCRSGTLGVYLRDKEQPSFPLFKSGILKVAYAI